MSRWHYLIVVCLGVALAVILWQTEPSLLVELEEVDSIAQQQFPDSYLINAKVTQYSEQGQISHTLKAQRINHFEANSVRKQAYAIMQEPRFQFFPEDSQQLPWYVSSFEARSMNNQEEILLIGDVELLQRNDQGVVVRRINTDELLIKPDQQYAETDKPVMMIDESGTSSSTGLKVSLAKDTVELTSQVRSLYEPR